MLRAMEQPYSDYDPFAQVYDEHWASGASAQLPIVRDRVLVQLPRGSRILDLCCGTGRIAAILGKEGYVVTGLDGSAAALAIARRNAPEAKLVHADARSFELPREQDAAISLFDSLNHVMRIGELAEVFKNVKKTLKEGAPFFFDLNTEYKYKTTWAGTFSIIDEQMVGAFRAAASIPDKLATFDAALFDKQSDGSWQRNDVRLKQTWYSEQEVREALQGAGFRHVDVYAPMGPEKIYFDAR
jgi:SAM-dependent methyltransferase